MDWLQAEPILEYLGVDDCEVVIDQILEIILYQRTIRGNG